MQSLYWIDEIVQIIKTNFKKFDQKKNHFLIYLIQFSN